MAGTDPAPGGPGGPQGQRPGTGDDFARRLASAVLEEDRRKSEQRQRLGAGRDAAGQLAKRVLDEDVRENSRQNSLWDSFKKLLQRVRSRLSGSGGQTAEGPATPSASGTGSPEIGNEQANPWLRPGQERAQGAGAPAPSAREIVAGMSPAEREPVRAAMLELIQENPRLQQLYSNRELPSAEALLVGPDPHPAPKNARDAGNQAQAPTPGRPPVASSQAAAMPGPTLPPIMVQTGSNSSVVVNVASQAPLPAMPTGEARRALDAVPGRERSGPSVSGNNGTRPSEQSAAARPTRIPAPASQAGRKRGGR